MENRVINVNGEIFSGENIGQAKISVFDRGFLFGDSIYEVTCTYDNVIFKLSEHLDRLWNSASRLSLPILKTRSELVHEIQKTLEVLNVDSAYIRLVVTRGEGEITLDPQSGHGNNTVIITRPLLPNPEWWYTEGVEMLIADVERVPKASVDPSVKSGNYLNNVMAYAEARKVGAFDALMLNREGNVTEGTTSNIWRVKNGKLSTPPLKSGLLGGITRKTLLELAREHNFDVREEEFNATELLDSDECFLSSTTKQLVPITRINKKEIGKGEPGPLTLQLLKIYRDHIREYIEQNKSQ